MLYRVLKRLSHSIWPPSHAFCGFLKKKYNTRKHVAKTKHKVWEPFLRVLIKRDSRNRENGLILSTIKLPNIEGGGGVTKHPHTHFSVRF